MLRNKKVRMVWNADEEKYYISVVDIVEILTESNEPRKYWNWLKNKLLNEDEFELSSITRQLKLEAKDGKYRLKERIDKEYDPEITINRALETYRKKGYSNDWINQRLKGINYIRWYNS